jgi:O-antigen/teichoic acid export membrane protein
LTTADDRRIGTEGLSRALSHEPDSPGLVWAVLKNTVAQVAGRGFITVCKYAAFIVLFRVLGVEAFGEYSLLLTLLVFGEILVDFGLNEVFVRELCQQPERRQRLLSLLSVARLLQALAAYATLAGLLFLLGYPWHMVQAGLIGGLQFLFLAGAQIYRALFKATLRMERDALAEILSSGLYAATVVAAAVRGASLETLLALLVVSRALYLLLAYLLGRRDFDIARLTFDWPEVRAAYARALPFGLCLLMGTLFTSQDMLLLYALDSRPEYAVGIYSAAYRFVMPLVLINAALMGALYPILSSYWGNRMADLRVLYQQGLDCAAVLSGAVFCGVYTSAGFMMSLFGDKAEAGIPVLRLLAWSILVAGLGSMVGPMFVIAGRLWLALGLAILGVAVNATLNLFLIPLFSYTGAAAATLGTELFVFICGLSIVQREIGYRVRWNGMLRTAAAAAVGVGAAAAAGWWDSLAGAVLAVAVFAAGAWLVGTVRPGPFMALLTVARRES